MGSPITPDKPAMGNTQQKLKKSFSSSSSSSSLDDDQNSNKLEEEEEEEEEEENNSSSSSSSSSSRFFTCQICREHVPLNQKFKNNNEVSMMMKRRRRRCDAHAGYCTDCIAKYIQVKVDEDINPSEIECPDLNCENVLDPVSCRSILAPRVFVRWCDRLCESAVLARFPNRAYCPFPYCSELVLNECAPPPNLNPNPRPPPPRWRYWLPWRSNKKNITILRRGSSSNYSKCPNCRNQFCFHCMVPWQESHRCSSKKIKKRNDALFLKMAELKKWKRCPNCKHYIERFEGCSLIECRCGTEFCYECGRREGWCVCYERIGMGIDDDRRHNHHRRANCFIKPLILTLRSLFNLSG